MVKREENNRFPRRASFEPPCHVDSAPPVRGCREKRKRERREEEGIFFPPLFLSLYLPRSSFYHLLRPFCFFLPLFLPFSLSTYFVELLPNERQESSYPTISFPHLGPRRAPSITRTSSFFSLSFSLFSLVYFPLASCSFVVCI